MNYSPWPDAGKRWRFEWRKATWMLCRPWYGANNVKYELRQLTMLFPITFWFPFVSYVRKWDGNKIAGFHFYLGWKPIMPHLDPAFVCHELNIVDKTGNTKYVQLGSRMGIGTAI